MSTVMEVTATMAAPIVDKWAMNLESVVLWSLTGGERTEDDIPSDFPLVEMRKPDCKIGVFACSDASFGAKVPWGEPLGTKVPCSTPMIVPDPDPKGEKVQSFVTPHARWLCATDDEAFLVELIIAIEAIGSKRRLGYGMVDSWSFVKAHDFTARDCLVYGDRTLRSLPVAWSTSSVPCFQVAVRPPYWMRRNMVGGVRAHQPFSLAADVQEDA